MNIPNQEVLKSGYVLLIDKPVDWTSFDVVNKIRKAINCKIGHAGTLDPLATGLLICCTGKKTKEITTYQAQEKEYTGIIQLGAVTPTFDLESEPEQHKDISEVNQDRIAKVLPQFMGDIMQMPPIHSAIKKDGQPAYKLAREGKKVKLNPRAVSIYTFETELKEEGALHFRIVCSKGTYIRSIANDLGAALGVGGYLKKLRRTKIGNFDVKDAKGVMEWYDLFKDSL